VNHKNVEAPLAVSGGPLRLPFIQWVVGGRHSQLCTQQAAELTPEHAREELVSIRDNVVRQTMQFVHSTQIVAEQVRLGNIG
jgi:hypothetical protein